MSLRKALGNQSGGSGFHQLFMKELLKAADELDERAAGAIEEICYNVIDDTPVGRPEMWGSYWRKMRGVEAGQYKAGHLKLNWQFSTMPASGELEGQDPSGMVPKAKVANVLNTIPSERYFFFNTADYAVAIEEGWSYQAPEGMLRKNVATWDIIASKWGAK